MQIDSNVILKDGSVVRIQKYEDSLAPKLRDFVNQLSDFSIIGRFLQPISREEAFKILSKKDELNVVAIRDDKIIGEGMLQIRGDKSAEVAVVVLDSFQNLGLGTSILGLLLEYAFKNNLTHVKSYVAPENYKMITVLKSLGFPIDTHIKQGLIEVEFPPSKLPEAIERFQLRESIGATNAVKIFLEPKSIALIGASGDRSTIGGQLLFNLIESNYQGPIFPVNPNREFVQGIKTFKSILDIPHEVEMAIIAVPAKYVNDVAKDCGMKGVKGLVIISSGFAEVGGEGIERQKELMEICNQYGMRLIGPNCMGVINTDPKVSLNGQFSPFKAIRGRIGFLSQSGALGIAVIDLTTKLGLGMSSFVSVGNKADISANDLIQYWEQDPNTDVILLYLESFGNPIKFGNIARRVTKKKPIIAVKSGRSSAGFRATQSHTGALLSSSDVTVDALFKKSGIIRAETLDEMFDAATILSSQPIPTGNRVAIVTNAGGAGILAADACEAYGLNVPEVPKETQEKLKQVLPPIAGLKNPIDMTAQGGPEMYEKVLDIVGQDDTFDSILVIFIPPVQMDQSLVSSRILNSIKKMKNKKTVVSVFMAYRGIPDILTSENIKLPSFPFPEDAAKALAKATEYGKWKNKPEEKIPDLEVKDPDLVKATISKALRAGREWLAYEEAKIVLNSYGIPVVKSFIAISPDEVGTKISTINNRVVIKAYSPKIVHKSDIGAVRLNVEPSKAKDVAEEMKKNLEGMGYPVEYFVVQEMIPEGIEMIVGITQDPSFGPIVVTGVGGKLVELIKDISIRPAPVTLTEAKEMISELKTHEILNGYRGGIVGDKDALVDIIVKVAKLAHDIPEIKELDLNPVMVLERGKGAQVVDFRIRVGVIEKEIPFIANTPG